MSNCTIDQSGVPMMSEKEIEIIDDLIEERKPKNCLEWGSGNSTIYFPKKHDCIEIWFSIEHNGHYKTYLDQRTKNNTGIFWTTDEDEYVNYPDKKYDFILIDGRHRMRCLEVALRRLNKDGFILLHDSGRKEYDVSKYEHKVLCEGEIPLLEGGFAHRGLTLFEAQ